MQHTRYKLGFWSVVAIVIGSQVGSGMYTLPAILAPYGSFSIIGWVISGGSALCLALTFSLLATWFPKTGGPHAYVQNAFGPHAAFFVGWAYWLVSWVSTTAVIVVCISYLSHFLGNTNPSTYVLLEIGFLSIITWLNIRGVHTAGRVEVCLATLKFTLLLALPIIALAYFKSSNIMVSDEVAKMGTLNILDQVILLTMWGFIGVETGTTPAGSVINPHTTIPRALMVGTFCVVLLYIVNSIGLMGLIPSAVLTKTQAPYVDAVQVIFGGNWHFLVSIIIFILCASTVNTWTLVSGQIILGLAEDKLVPQFFAKRNKYHAPVYGILTSSIFTIPILILTSSTNLIEQVKAIIEYSVTTFLFVYLICTLATIKIAIKKPISLNKLQWLALFIVTCFCCVILYKIPHIHFMVSILFVISGLPIYVFWYLRTNKKTAKT